MVITTGAWAPEGTTFVEGMNAVLNVVCASHPLSEPFSLPSLD